MSALWRARRASLAVDWNEDQEGEKWAVLFKDVGRDGMKRAHSKGYMGGFFRCPECGRLRWRVCDCWELEDTDPGDLDNATQAGSDIPDGYDYFDRPKRWWKR